MMNQPQTDAKVDARLRVLRILWLALTSTIGLYALVAYMAGPSEQADTSNEIGGLPLMLVIFFALAIVVVAISFVLKRAFYARAEREQKPELVQTGLILALVLSEMAALFGMLGVFLTGSYYSYFLFVLGVVGCLLHFPRREDLLAASNKLRV